MNLLKIPRSKKAQEIFGMSFGMIFSIILIVFFIVVAIIAVRHVLSVMSCSKVGLFISNIQDEVDSAWNAEEQSVEFKGNLPSGVKKICFSNTQASFSGPDRDLGIEIDIYPDMNMFMIPLNKACDMGEVNIKHIDIEKITRTNNPYCVDVSKGKVSMMIEKDSNEALVSIRK